MEIRHGRTPVEQCAHNIATRIGMIFSSAAIDATVEEIEELIAHLNAKPAAPAPDGKGV